MDHHPSTLATTEKTVFSSSRATFSDLLCVAFKSSRNAPYPTNSHNHNNNLLFMSATNDSWFGPVGATSSGLTTNFTQINSFLFCPTLIDTKLPLGILCGVLREQTGMTIVFEGFSCIAK